MPLTDLPADVFTLIASHFYQRKDVYNLRMSSRTLAYLLDIKFRSFFFRQSIIFHPQELSRFLSIATSPSYNTAINILDIHFSHFHPLTKNATATCLAVFREALAHLRGRPIGIELRRMYSITSAEPFLADDGFLDALLEFVPHVEISSFQIASPSTDERFVDILNCAGARMAECTELNLHISQQPTDEDDSLHITDAVVNLLNAPRKLTKLVLNGRLTSGPRGLQRSSVFSNIPWATDNSPILHRALERITVKTLTSLTLLSVATQSMCLRQLIDAQQERGLQELGLERVVILEGSSWEQVFAGLDLVDLKSLSLKYLADSRDSFPAKEVERYGRVGTDPVQVSTNTAGRDVIRCINRDSATLLAKLKSLGWETEYLETRRFGFCLRRGSEEIQYWPI